MLVTALAPKIGYDKAAAIARAAQPMARHCGRKRCGSAMSPERSSTDSYGLRRWCGPADDHIFHAYNQKTKCYNGHDEASLRGDVSNVAEAI